MERAGGARLLEALPAKALGHAQISRFPSPQFAKRMGGEGLGVGALLFLLTRPSKYRKSPHPAPLRGATLPALAPLAGEGWSKRLNRRVIVSDMCMP